MRPITVPFFISHQGCPHRCVFCDQRRISGGKEALPTGPEIIETIERYARTANGRPQRVAFFGGSFTALPAEDQERLLLPLQTSLASAKIEGITVSTRPDEIDQGRVLFLKEMGVDTVELGVQSLDADVLRLSGRGYSADDVASACRCVRGNGLRLGIQLMTGLPGDTPEKSICSIRGAIDLRPTFFRIYPTLVIEGTELESLFREGSYRPLSISEAVSLCKEMLRISLRSGIPVIRLGLQATEELSTGKTVVAGPFHPAFRQLVEAELLYDAVSGAARGISGDVIVRCPASRISDVVGQKRCNLERLEREAGMRVTAVESDPLLSPFEVLVVTQGETRMGNILRNHNEVGGMP